MQNAMHEREAGEVKMWQSEKGFGFIKPDNPGENDIFAHVSALPDDLQSLSKGERVTFVRKVGQKGFMATEVELEQ
jgi:CspA family cold shock protein